MRLYFRSTSLVMLLMVTLLAGCERGHLSTIIVDDVLHINNAPTTDSIFIMIDGSRVDASGVSYEANDVPFRATGANNFASAALVNFIPMGARIAHTSNGEIPLPGSNEVVVFAPGRAPALVENVQWTEGGDVIEVRLRDPIHIKAKVWVPDGYDRSVVERARIEANRIMNNEGVGAHLDSFIYSFPIFLSTAQQASIPEHMDTAQSQFREQFLQTFDLDPDYVNIVVLDTIESSASRGHCFQDTANSRVVDIIILAKDSRPDLLIHELGHAFGLEHTNESSFVRDSLNYDVENVMHSLSDSRRYFTEGQIFRAHASKESLLWRLADPLTRWNSREIYSRSGGIGSGPPDHDLTWQYNLPPLCRRLIAEGSRGDCLR